MPNTGCRNQKVEDRIFKIDIRKTKKKCSKNRMNISLAGHLNDAEKNGNT